MAEGQTRYTFDRVVRMVLSAISIVAVVSLLRYLSDVLIPFVVAVVLAYLLNPLVSVFEQRTKRRGLAVGITIGGLAVLGLALIVLILPLVYSQITRFGRDLEKLRFDLATSITIDVPPATQVPDPATFVGPPDPGPPKSTTGLPELHQAWERFQSEAHAQPRSQRFAGFREDVEGTFVGDLLEAFLRYVNSEDFSKHVLQAARRLAESGWSILTFAANLILGLTGAILVLLYLVFLLLDFPDFARSWKGLLPPSYREGMVEFLFEFDLALRQYLRGQSVVSLLYGAFLALGFWLIGLPMAVPLGLSLGLLSMVPYLQAVGLIPALLLAIMRSIEGESGLLGSIVMTLMVFGVVQLVTDWFVTPRVMGKATGLRPVVVLLGVFVWGKLLGFLGLILAIPLTCLGIAYYRRYVLQESRIGSLEGRRKD